MLAQFQRGDTALHISLRARSKRITELLLRNPRNSRLLYRPNKSGETPYNIDAYHQKQILNQIFGHSKYQILMEIKVFQTKQAANKKVKSFIKIMQLRMEENKIIWDRWEYALYHKKE